MSNIRQEVTDVLIKVRELLTPSDAWIKDEWATTYSFIDDEPVPVNADDREASCWCIGGAFIKVTGDPGIGDNEYPCEDVPKMAWELVREAAGGNQGLIEWNDLATTTHDDVLLALDKAIANSVDGIILAEEIDDATTIEFG